jgi:hypothetical protein
MSAGVLQAQSKIFKEVGEEISTQFKTITQDNALVGYLAFTKLEKSDADSFNYRISIMDENLNDIGTVNFRQVNLYLQAVSFEKDVLSLGYIKSPMIAGVGRKEARKAKKNEDYNTIMVQFVGLNGKIINAYTKPVDLTTAVLVTGYFSTKQTGYLKHALQISNVANTGFSVFYGDEKKNELLLFDLKGNMIHEKTVSAEISECVLQTAGQNIYLLTKKNDHFNWGNYVVNFEGGYTVYMYNAGEPDAEYRYKLTDPHGNSLKVLSFDNDPVSGHAYLAGCVINTSRYKDFITAHDYSHAPYLGVFTLDLGKTDKDVKATYSYWDKETIPGLTKEGLFSDKDFYVKYHTAFRDFKGNTVFAGSAMAEKRLLGAAKYRMTDGVFVQQDASGGLKLDNNIPCDESAYFGPAAMVAERDKKAFYKVVNLDARTHYIVIDDEDNTYIYNVDGKKVMRTIQHKDGKIKTRVYPAKEGHVMVSEYNSREKSTKLSIEAL